MNQAVKPINSVESKTSTSADATEALLKSMAAMVGATVIPFDQAPRQIVSKYVIQFPNGTQDEQEFIKRSAAVKALSEIDAVIEHCRTVLQLNKEEFMSEESEREWIEDNIESEAAEIGYVVIEVQS